MQIIDEKSLIKKYQNEIRCLKEELEQLKRGIVMVPQMKDGEDDIVLLKQKVSLEEAFFLPLCIRFTVGIVFYLSWSVSKNVKFSMMCNILLLFSSGFPFLRICMHSKLFSFVLKNLLSTYYHFFLNVTFESR